MAFAAGRNGQLGQARSMDDERNWQVVPFRPQKGPSICSAGGSRSPGRLVRRRNYRILIWQPRSRARAPPDQRASLPAGSTASCYTACLEHIPASARTRGQSSVRYDERPSCFRRMIPSPRLPAL
jgi:hypothetical protein